MTGVYVLGVGMTKFGKHPDRDAAGFLADGDLNTVRQQVVEELQQALV